MTYVRNSPIVAKWFFELTQKEIREVIYSLLDVAYDNDNIHIGNNAPYWEKSGDPLVAGQVPWITKD